MERFQQDLAAPQEAPEGANRRKRFFFDNPIPGEEKHRITAGKNEMLLKAGMNWVLSMPRFSEENEVKPFWYWLDLEIRCAEAGRNPGGCTCPPYAVK